jgi:hypothetical protein
MELTGKCKEEFFKWKKSRWMDSGLIQVSVVSPLMFDLTTNFYKLPLEMQYGVYVDFFDSVGVRVFIDEEFDIMGQYQRGFNPVVNNIELYKDNDCFETRPEARTSAIEKANEIYNLNQYTT